MTTFQVLKDIFEQSIQKFKNWRKIRICKSLGHRTSNYKIISTSIIQDWTDSLNNQQDGLLKWSTERIMIKVVQLL